MKQSGTKYYSQTNFMPAQLRDLGKRRLLRQQTLQRAGRNLTYSGQRRNRPGERLRRVHHRGDHRK